MARLNIGNNGKNFKVCIVHFLRLSDLVNKHVSMDDNITISDHGKTKHGKNLFLSQTLSRSLEDNQYINPSIAEWKNTAHSQCDNGLSM